MSKRYEYKYEILTTENKKITSKSKHSLILKARSEKNAREILRLRYPSCQIIKCKTKTRKNFNLLEIEQSLRMNQ